MGYYTGIDVSLELSHLCVMDTAGTVVKEAKVPSDPDALVAWFVELGLPMERIGLEAGPLSQWLYAGLTAAKFPVVLLETRQVRDAFRFSCGIPARFEDTGKNEGVHGKHKDGIEERPCQAKR